MLEAHKTPKAICPHCGENNDQTALAFGHGRPEAGAFTLCAMCGEWAVFNTDMTLRKLNVFEYIMIMNDKRSSMLQKALRLTKEKYEQAGKDFGNARK